MIKHEFVCSRCFEDVLKVSAYSLLAMLSKETGVMAMPMVVIYYLIYKQGSITSLYRDKDKARTILKYILLVRKRKHVITCPSA